MVIRNDNGEELVSAVIDGDKNHLKIAIILADDRVMTAIFKKDDLDCWFVGSRTLI